MKPRANASLLLRVIRSAHVEKRPNPGYDVFCARTRCIDSAPKPLPPIASHVLLIQSVSTFPCMMVEIQRIGTDIYNLPVGLGVQLFRSPLTDSLEARATLRSRLLLKDCSASDVAFSRPRFGPRFGPHERHDAQPPSS